MPTDPIQDVPTGFFLKEITKNSQYGLISQRTLKEPTQNTGGYIVNGISGYFVKELFTGEASSLLKMKL